ncbi:thioredoxin family protein [Thalassotalea sp. ND16A]|uniref:thioredoxin family protein n=1 Tax=Thalassotalea sp. ND16A TaxID=1535422 RepID=UPI00051D5637|nr:thioredoxin family protein [Thalassotalea sp. ND16A]KGJ99139.1 hypothetical protein ND16A_3903 [Thalassotalea sp. ND16A]
MNTNNADINISLLKHDQKNILLLAATLLLGLAILLTIKPVSASGDVHLGLISKSQLLDNHEDFAENYSGYQTSDEELAAVAALPDDLIIKVFFGTWCHDSEREVPRLLQSFKKSPVSIELYALDTNKSDPDGLATANNIKYTPTIIVYQHDQEVTRIIERPENSLSEDILSAWLQNKQ